MTNNNLTFDFFEKNDKHFFAGLFNTAMQNFDLSLKELKKRIDNKDLNKKKTITVIEYAFDSTNRPQIEYDNNFKYLSESLVFIRRIPAYIAYRNKNKKHNEKNILLKDFLKDFLLNLYKQLDNYRNYYTHFEHHKIKENQEIIKFLDYLLYNSANAVKDNKVKTDAVKKKLYNKFKSDFETIVQHKNDWVERQNEEEGKKYGKFNANNDKGKNFALNDIFRYFINEKKNKLSYDACCNKIERIKVDGEKDKIKTLNEYSTSGFIQLLALFLNKKQVNILFDGVIYTKYNGTTQLQKLIARWVYTYESYKDIKRLFKSEYDNDALLLQMVSELTKCPRELYPYLSEEDKNEFVEDINVYFKENANLFDDDALVSHEIIRKRYQDKFAYFAIRYLDEFANFPSLRFQVSMGKFNHDTREKTYSSTKKKTERKILEKINVFEKLTIATKAKNKYFEDETNIKVNDWVEYPRPKYQFSGNTIGIWINDTDYKLEILKERKKNKPQKDKLLEKMGLKDKYKRPIAYLSIYELPAILYAFLIKGKKGSDIENIIKGQINQQVNLFNKLEDIKDPKRLPKKAQIIINNVQNSSLNWDKLEEQLQKEKTIDPLYDIRKYYTKKPKNPSELSLSEKGKLATWLSDDIKRFTSKGIKKEWRGYHFAEFQALMSYYDIDKNSINNYLKTDLKIVGKNDFAFYEALDFTKKTLYGFYINYLNKRKEYITGLTDRFDRIENDILLQPFKANRFKLDSLEKYKEHKLKSPIMLPRGIFDNKPTGYNKSKGEKPAFAEWFKVSMDRVDAQEFYNFNKYYPFTQIEIRNKLVVEDIKISTNKGFKEQFPPLNKIKKEFALSTNEKKVVKANIKKDTPTKEEIKQAEYKYIHKKIYKNETYLRRTMRNDYYLLQMIKSFFNDVSHADQDAFESISLKDFYLTKAEKEKIVKQSATQSEREKGDTSAFIFNDSYILNKRIELPLLNGKITCNVPLKESSKYKKLAQDTRVIQLTNYYPANKWSIEEILNELNDFELVRSKKLFKQVHLLEEKIYNATTDKSKLCNILLNGKQIPNFRKYIESYYLNDKKEKEEFTSLLEKEISFAECSKKIKQLFVLIRIRNKFSHNQLISVEYFTYLNKNIDKKSDTERVATYLNSCFTRIVEQLK